MVNDKFRLMVVSGLFLLVNSIQAYAYLDPGTGSMLIQMLIGGVVAAFFTLKMYWYQLKSFVKRKLGYPEEHNSEDETNTNSMKKEE